MAAANLILPDRGVGRRSFVLCPWTTVRGNSATITSIVQDPADWVDVERYNDATFIIDCAEVTNPTGATNGYVLLYIESSATPDESGFKPVLGPIPLAITALPLVVTTASASAYPLARFVRWRIVPTGPASTFDATFRIRGSGSRRFYFAPTMVGGVTFWVRADRGLTFTNQTVTRWADQSGVNDPNRTLIAGSSPPAFTLADTNFGGQPSVSFSGNANCYFTSAGIWSTVMNQADSWLLVGMLASASTNYFINGNTNVFGYGQAVWVTTAGGSAINASAGTTRSETTAWTTAGAFLCEFNGGTGNLYALNSFTAVAATGTIGSSVVNALSFGANNVALGGGSTWNGPIVEAIAFNGLLSAGSKALLRTYLNNRYGLAIT